MLFLTSDCHFDHANIIEYCHRPFTSVEKMNNAILTGWNQRVKPTDTVIHVGDFCFGKRAKYWMDQLNGNKIFLAGNHDRNNGVNTKIRSMEIVFNKEPIWITHRPHDFNDRYYLNLVGHVHDDWLYCPYGVDDTLLINVGVDQWNFKPVRVDEAYLLYQSIQRTGTLEEVFNA